jgi:hypothetical protein
MLCCAVQIATERLAWQVLFATLRLQVHAARLPLCLQNSPQVLLNAERHSRLTCSYEAQRVIAAIS